MVQHTLIIKYEYEMSQRCNYSICTTTSLLFKNKYKFLKDPIINKENVVTSKEFMFHTAINTNTFFGPIGVQALPLGMRRQNVVAILNGVIFALFFSNRLLFLPEGIVVGF